MIGIARVLLIGSLAHAGPSGMPRPAMLQPVFAPYDSLATITTDTGDLAPGNKEFARFTNPGMCLGAVQVATELARTSVAAQVAYALHEYGIAEDGTTPTDSSPASVVAVARRCRARFTVANVPAAELPNLFILTLAAGEDSLAQAIVERRLTLAKDLAGRAAVFQDAIDGYLQARPARASAAESVAAQIDAMGSAMASAALIAHDSLLSYATYRVDAPSMRREAEHLIAIGQSAPMSVIQYAWEPILDAYISLGTLAYVNAPDSVTALVTRAKEDLGRFPSTDQWPSGHAVRTPGMSFPFKTASLEKVRNTLIPFNAARYAGRSFPPLSATYWFPKAPKSWPPEKGVPSLVMYGGIVNLCTRIDTYVSHPLPGCRDLYAYLPYLFKQYGNRLAVTFVAATEFTTVQSGALTAAQQADTLRHFFLDYLKLPITLGVIEDSVKVLPGLDGRKLLRDTSFYGNFERPAKWNRDPSPLVLFYDARGELRYVDSRSGFDAPELRALIERAMRERVTREHTARESMPQGISKKTP